MNELELKRKRIETFGKVLGLGIAGFLFAPIAYATITGVISLLVVGVIALAVVNVGVPWFAVSLANWRLKALKSAAAANPIETLENRYQDRQNALVGIRENIKKSYSVLQELYAQIQEHAEKYPNRPSQYLEKYNKLKALVELRGKKYKQAQVNLAAFGELIEEKRSDWKIAQTMAAASELANVGEDFTSKLLQDTALNTIQDGLNMAFSELETSLLDEQPTGTVTVTVEATPVTSGRKTAAIPEKCGPPTLDLGFDSDTLEADLIPARRQKIATA
jgi:hypothetical protein